MSNVTTKEKAARPLGVVGSLAAGFEMVGRHLGLIVLPVLLDLFLWLGPRISIAPLLEQFAAFLLTQSKPDPATLDQVTQAVQVLKQFGEQSNLLALLSALPLLNVPSLLAQHASGALSPLGQPHVVLTTSVLAVLGWGSVLVPVGLVLGFVYLNGLARWVRTMRAPAKSRPALSKSEGPAQIGKSANRKSHIATVGPAPSKVEGPAPSGVEGPAPSPSAPLGVDSAEGTGPAPTGWKACPTAETRTSGVGKFIRVFLFAAGLLMVGLVAVPLWMLLVGASVALVPLLGFVVWSLGIGLGSYLVLHLLFVVPGVLLGGRGLARAIWESILLIHTQFPSVVGLILLVVLIYQGLGFVWALPAGDSWSLLVGILGNGCIATGLTAAFFVFYQERVGLLVGVSQTPETAD